MKRKSTDNHTRTCLGSIGLLPSMLIIFISALLVSISLAILVFSLINTTVYANIKAGEMVPQLRGVASAASKYMLGEAYVDDLLLLTRASDAALVILDSEGNEFMYHDPKLPDKPNDDHSHDDVPWPGGAPDNIPDNAPDIAPDKPRDEFSEDSEKRAAHERYLRFCKSVFGDVMESDGVTEYSKYDKSIGIVVALPVVSGEERIGAAYLIMPSYDLSEASRTMVLALVISFGLVTILLVPPVYAVTRWLNQPIKKATKAALALAEGDYSGRVEIVGSTEVRELGVSFNTLADNLQDKIGDLVVERNRLRAVLDSMSEGIVFEDAFGGIQNNASALTLLGGKPGTDITELPAFASVSSTVHSALKSGESCAEVFEIGERTIRISASVINEESGAVAGSVALLMDITEAERLEQTRRDYVANVSHELRTPLASIRGIADMLNDGLVKNESDKYRYYGYILKESIRLSTLINDLLELSRLQSGGVALEMRRVELYELAADVADRMSEPAAANDMSIDLMPEEGCYYARTNADRIEQVLISLVDNAVKHGVHGGRIGIGFCETEDKWNVFVENPADVDEKDVEHLFERFYKADTAHTGEGTGLGLAITEEVLHLMGERIWIDHADGIIRFTFTVEKEPAPTL